MTKIQAQVHVRAMRAQPIQKCDPCVRVVHLCADGEHDIAAASTSSGLALNGIVINQWPYLISELLHVKPSPKSTTSRQRR